MKKVYKTSASSEELSYLKEMGLKSREIISFFPVDRADCVCQSQIKDLVYKFSIFKPADVASIRVKMGKVECKRNKEGYKKYRIYCNGCGSVLGECFGKDESLNEWCDLHYIASSEIVKKDGEEKCYWLGCMAVIVS